MFAFSTKCEAKTTGSLLTCNYYRAWAMTFLCLGNPPIQCSLSFIGDFALWLFDFFFLLFCFVGFFSAFLSFLKVLFVSDVYFCTSKWKRRRISSCRSTLSWRFWEQVTVTLRKFYMGPDTPFLSKLRFRDSAFVEFSHPGEKFLTVTLTVIRLA